jgi:hypothetical protein
MTSNKRRQVVAGVVAALLTTVGVGAAAAPNGSAAAASSPLHTLRVTAHSTAGHSVGKTTFVGADTDRSPSTHAIVGYDVLSGKFHPATGTATLRVAAALKGGTIDMVFNGTGTNFHGRILQGTGKYSGITGTCTATSPTNSSPITHVVLRYHL